MLRSTTLAATVALALCCCLPFLAIATDTCLDGSQVERTTVGSPDHDRTGNRVVPGCRPFTGARRDFELEAVPTWVVAHPRHPGHRWILAMPDGMVREFHHGDSADIGQLAPGEAPVVTVQQGELVIRERSRSSGIDDPIPGARWAGDGTIAALPVSPTDRYPHGVLGDDIEASGLLIWTDHSSIRTVELPEAEVIEGISAIVARLGGDLPTGFLVTVSGATDGARLRAYDESGQVIGESEPIGQGFRWLHQIGVGPTGPGGEVEVIAVRTPHIGGIVEAYRLEDDRFVRVATIEGYSSHVIGSPNLDMALLADIDADGQLEVIVPTQAMTELAILERTPDGFHERQRLPLDGRLATNVAAAIGRDGRLSLAAATDKGRLHIFD